MPTIHATNREGVTQQIDARTGLSLMRVLKEAGEDILAMCGGNAICATCHVYVDGEWQNRLNPPDEGERDTLGTLQLIQPNSRLACQIPVTAQLDGLTVTLAPQE